MLSTEQPQTARNVGPNNSGAQKKPMGHNYRTYRIPIYISCSPTEFFGFGQHVQGQCGVNYMKICMIHARVPDHMPMEVGGRIPHGWLKHSSAPSYVKVLQQPVEESAALNLWTFFQHAMRCQNSFAASCGSALTSHGLVRAQEVTTCTRLV